MFISIALTHVGNLIIECFLSQEILSQYLKDGIIDHISVQGKENVQTAATRAVSPFCLRYCATIATVIVDFIVKNAPWRVLPESHCGFRSEE